MASRSSSSPPTTAWPSASTSRTCAPWAAPPLATAASRSARATTSSAPPPLERAAQKGLTNQVEAAIDEVADSTAVTPLELSGDPTELSAPAISEETAAKLEKLDKQLGLTPCLILSVSESGYGKRNHLAQ